MRNRYRNELRSPRTLATTCAILLFFAPVLANAQMEDAYGVSFQNTMKLAEIIAEAAEGKDRDTAFNAANEMRANLDMMEKRIEDSVSMIDELDQPWLKERKESALKRISDLRANTGTLQSALQSVGRSYDSDLSSFKSSFNDYHSEMEEFWNDLSQYGRQLEDRVKKYRGVWRS